MVPRKEKNKKQNKTCGTWSNELIQSNIWRLILLLLKKKKESTRKHCVNRNPTQHCNILYQKRTWKRRYTHLLISESSCCRSKNKKQKTPTILSFKYVHQFKLGNKSVKKDSEMLTLLSSGHGDLNGVTSLKPELVLVP